MNGGFGGKSGLGRYCGYRVGRGVCSVGAPPIIPPGGISCQ